MSSRAAQVNAARQQQEIAQLQKQLDRATQLLDSVTKAGAMTQAQVASARQAALAAREAIHQVAQQDNEVSQKLRRIEDGILEAQSEDSEYAKALDEIHLARRAIDTELHRILKWQPPADDEAEATRLSELAHLTAEEREKLNADSRYTTKQAALHQSMDNLISVRKKLFEASEEWKKAHEEHHRIDQEQASLERSVQGAANDSSEGRQELRDAAEIAASARATIAHAQARLNALGAKPKAPTSDKKTGAKESNR